MLKLANLQYFPLAPFARSRVTDEALIAETVVWPNFFLMNIFFALKGSKLFIIIYCDSLCCLLLSASVLYWPSLCAESILFSKSNRVTTF